MNPWSLPTRPPLRDTGKPVTVVTDPHFNALLVHEIIGHPNELDRALKMETAYAGRSWLFNDFEHNQIGRQVASPLLSAYSDPSLPGFGHYAMITKVPGAERSITSRTGCTGVS